MSECDRCGKALPQIDVTNFGDREPRYLDGMCPCPPLPKSCCTFCRRPVDSGGRCENIDCFFVGQVVPDPVLV